MDVRRVGQYELYDEIASGGMAIVRFGRFVNELGLGRLVAIKCLHPWFGSDAAFTSALIEEAKLALRVRHTNVVATVDVLVPHDEVFLVMDYVHGVSLSELLKRSGEERPVPVPIASAIMVGILHGIHAAHEATAVDGEPLGIVHRDVSPQNVLVDVDGIARVFDFGVARAVGRVQNTKDGVVKGKMGYMSPEQFMRDEVDRRTDVFAASVVFWEMLVGRQLFPDASLGAVYGRMLEPRIEPPSAKVPGLSTSYDLIVLKGLSQLADDRFSTARDMALAVEEAGPLATQREVGAWVEDLASETLRQRAKRIAQVERRAPLPPQQKHLSVPPPGPDPSDKATWMPRNRQQLVPPVGDGRSETALGDVPVGSGAVSPVVASGGTEAKSRWWAVAGALALVAVLWIAISAVSGSRSRTAPGVTTAVTVAVPSSAASAPFAVREPMALASVSPEDSSPLSPAVSLTPPSEGSLPRVSPGRVPVSRPPPAPPVKCNPPYYIDGRGVRVLKPECL
jgi:serine/threonine protein kinase